MKPSKLILLSPRMAKAALLALTLTTAAQAALPDEIQVYDNEISGIGEKGVELHVNTTPRGNRTQAYPGERITAHGWRLTPEFSYGLSRDFDAGLYIPTVFDSKGNGTLAGIKFRFKWLPIRPVDGATGWYVGTNLELSRVKYEFDDARTAMELRNIIGWHGTEWLFAVNPTFRWALAPGYRGAPDFSLGVRSMRVFREDLRAGVELYTDFGPTNALASRSNQARLLFGVVELDLPGNWSVQLGLGRGSGTGDPWTVKSIISFPI